MTSRLQELFDQEFRQRKLRVLGEPLAALTRVQVEYVFAQPIPLGPAAALHGPGVHLDGGYFARNLRRLATTNGRTRGAMARLQ